MNKAMYDKQVSVSEKVCGGTHVINPAAKIGSVATPNVFISQCKRCGMWVKVNKKDR